MNIYYNNCDNFSKGGCLGMNLKALPAIEGDHNLKNYEETYRHFDWAEAEKHFSWHETGKLNAAYEAIDRHAESFRKNKVALYYKDAKRDEKYTFKEMKEESNEPGMC